MRFFFITAATLLLSSMSIFAQKVDMMPASRTITPAKAASAATKASEASDTAKVEPKTTTNATKTTAPVSAPDDAAIAKAIKDKLASLPSLKNATIEVMVKNGVATLTGNVKNAGLKGVATNAAKRIAGVKQVENKIVAEKGFKK